MGKINKLATPPRGDVSASDRVSLPKKEQRKVEVQTPPSSKPADMTKSQRKLVADFRRQANQLFSDRVRVLSVTRPQRDSGTERLLLGSICERANALSALIAVSPLPPQIRNDLYDDLQRTILISVGESGINELSRCSVAPQNETNKSNDVEVSVDQLSTVVEKIGAIPADQITLGHLAELQNVVEITQKARHLLEYGNFPAEDLARFDEAYAKQKERLSDVLEHVLKSVDKTHSELAARLPVIADILPKDSNKLGVHLADLQGYEDKIYVGIVELRQLDTKHRHSAAIVDSVVEIARWAELNFATKVKASQNILKADETSLEPLLKLVRDGKLLTAKISLFKEVSLLVSNMQEYVYALEATPYQSDGVEKSARRIADSLIAIRKDLDSIKSTCQKFGYSGKFYSTLTSRKIRSLESKLDGLAERVEKWQVSFESARSSRTR